VLLETNRLGYSGYDSKLLNKLSLLTLIVVDLSIVWNTVLVIFFVPERILGWDVGEFTLICSRSVWSPIVGHTLVTTSHKRLHLITLWILRNFIVEISELRVELLSVNSLWSRSTLAALNPTINYIDCCTESFGNILGFVNTIWFPVSCCNIMHTRFWTLRSHVKPQSRQKCDFTITLNSVRIIKQGIDTAVSLVWERTVIVVPWELKWSSTIVLLSFYGRPSCCRPVSRCIITSSFS